MSKPSLGMYFTFSNSDAASTFVPSSPVIISSAKTAIFVVQVCFQSVVFIQIAFLIVLLLLPLLGSNAIYSHAFVSFLVEKPRLRIWPRWYRCIRPAVAHPEKHIVLISTSESVLSPFCFVFVPAILLLSECVSAFLLHPPLLICSPTLRDQKIHRSNHEILRSPLSNIDRCCFHSRCEPSTAICCLKKLESPFDTALPVQWMCH